MQTARLAEAAARIRFANIDNENFLRIVAPVDGVITDVIYSRIVSLTRKKCH